MILAVISGATPVLCWLAFQAQASLPCFAGYHLEDMHPGLARGPPWTISFPDAYFQVRILIKSRVDSFFAAVPCACVFRVIASEARERPGSPNLA